jgi:hypothetical protein
MAEELRVAAVMLRDLVADLAACRRDRDTLVRAAKGGGVVIPPLESAPAD